MYLLAFVPKNTILLLCRRDLHSVVETYAICFVTSTFRVLSKLFAKHHTQFNHTRDAYFRLLNEHLTCLDVYSDDLSDNSLFQPFYVTHVFQVLSLSSISSSLIMRGYFVRTLLSGYFGRGLTLNM
jgi:hypothetical protein